MFQNDDNRNNSNQNELNELEMREEQNITDTIDEWTEYKELEERIRKAGEELKIPDELLPEQMRKKIEAKGVEKREKEKQKRRWMRGVAAAAVVFLVGSGIYASGLWNLMHQGFNHSNDRAAETAYEETEAAADMAVEEATEAAAEEMAAEETESASVHELKKEDKLSYAKSYKEIYGAIQEVQEYYRSQWEEKDMAAADMSDGAAEEVATEAAAEDAGSSVSKDSGSPSSYSKTNVQVENVDEGDIIKTDGKYIYRLNWNDSDIDIVRADNGKMTLQSEIKAENPQDMYVQGDTLIVVDTGYVKTQSKNGNIEDKSYTTICFYNIKDRTKPVLINDLTQSGYYNTSRVYDNYLYILTGDYISSDCKEEDVTAYIPIVSEKVMDADDIYIPKQTMADSYLTMASVDITDPSGYIDSKAVMSEGSQLYMTTENMYIADYMWMQDTGSSDNDSTEITKFSIKDGMFELKARATVKGNMRDDFSMNEHEGNLRLVTTVSHYDKKEVYDDLAEDVMGYSVSASTDNSLYILDENLKQIGAIEGLAEDERIYSARFMGDIGYFVTFRETDPLFSVDLSDPTNPKIIGQLKIPGFSEYLHFYDENLLLGIGQEATEDGEITGLKISMFDISDPADVKEKDKLVLKDYWDSDALYNYKSVLIDTERNLFGFGIWGSGNTPDIIKEAFVKGLDIKTDRDNHGEYILMSYEKEKGFVCELAVPMEDGDIYGKRGLFIDSVLYVADTEDKDMQSFDITEGKYIAALK